MVKVKVVALVVTGAALVRVSTGCMVLKSAGVSNRPFKNRRTPLVRALVEMGSEVEYE